MQQATAGLKQMRIIHIAFVVAIVLYLYAAELAVGGNGARPPVAMPMLLAMTVMAGLDLAIAAYFRETKLQPALENLRRDIDSSEALKQWRFATLLSMVLVMSVALYGFALRFLGASRQTSWAFYLVALIMLTLWRPKLEMPAELPSAVGNQ